MKEEKLSFAGISDAHLQGSDHRLSNPEMMRRAIAEAMAWLTEHLQ
jgi:hypothetical protein